MKKAEGIRWDLSDLYQDLREESIARDLESALEGARRFRESYYGKINSPDCDASRLTGALQEYESLLEGLYRPYATAQLLFTADTTSDVNKGLLARAQDISSRFDNETLFLGLEIQKMPEEQAQALLQSDELQNYRHFIEVERLFSPYTLSEKEEQIINRKNLSGRVALTNLFDEFTSSFVWELEIDGEKRRLTASEMQELLRHPDPDLRYRVKKAHDGRYGEHAVIFTNIFGGIVKDHATEMELRGYEHPMQPSYLRNQVPAEVVETMMQVTAENYELVQKYNRLKAKHLGMKKLRGSDLYAPVAKSQREIPFPEAQQLVVESLSAFSPEFGDLIAKAFDGRWIDAEVRPGKRRGAFCMGIVPSLHPYVLMNYVDNLDSVYTLAHELGHALHDLLAGEKQTLLNYYPPLVLAETASVFSEMLLTRKLLAQELDRETRLQILASKLEDFFGTISRQTMYTLFERDAHLAGAERRLSAEELCKLWIARRDEMYGDTVEFLPEERWFWSVIPHFIHTRFYCYAYTFGALLVLALFHRYEQQGAEFVPQYRSLLAAGGSQKPEDLIAGLGMDLHEREFWQGGFRVIESLLEEFEEMVK